MMDQGALTSRIQTPKMAEAIDPRRINQTLTIFDKLAVLSKKLGEIGDFIRELETRISPVLKSEKEGFPKQEATPLPNESEVGAALNEINVVLGNLAYSLNRLIERVDL